MEVDHETRRHLDRRASECNVSPGDYLLGLIERDMEAIAVGGDTETIEFAPSSLIEEWEEEIERWLPEATGHSVYGALVTDLSALEDFMETDYDNPVTGEDGEEFFDKTPESRARARAALLRHGVDIEDFGGSRVNLVELARRTAAARE